MFRWRWVQQHPDPRATRVEFSYLRLPIWFPPLFFLSYPVASVLARFVRSRRPKEGCCPYCDYDLTGNLSGVCSECGLPIAGHRG